MILVFDIILLYKVCKHLINIEVSDSMRFWQIFPHFPCFPVKTLQQLSSNTAGQAFYLLDFLNKFKVSSNSVSKSWLMWLRYESIMNEDGTRIRCCNVHVEFTFYNTKNQLGLFFRPGLYIRHGHCIKKNIRNGSFAIVQSITSIGLTVNFTNRYDLNVIIGDPCKEILY